MSVEQTTADDVELQLRDSTYRHGLANCEQLSAAAHHVRTNWGEYGYRLGVVDSADWRYVIFGCRASDGSEFFFAVDRYGNVTDIPQGVAS